MEKKNQGIKHSKNFTTRQKINLQSGMVIFFTFFTSFTFAQSPFLLVLGTAQDGGYPHLGCEKACCHLAWKNDSLKRAVVSLALVDPVTKKWWLFEATPDIKTQLQNFKTQTKNEYKYLPEGIFITHAHIGHYSGLMQFGREVFNTGELKVYVLPKLKKFIETNGPWSQLVTLKNITLLQLDTSVAVKLEKNIFINAFTVPHRDEFSETAGFKISASETKYLFIPDIDKWEKWDKKIIEEVKKVNYAFLDATFSDINELKNRKINEVPHPFVPETIALFKDTEKSTKAKIHFIHFNHTNPLLWDKTMIQNITDLGYHLAEEGKRY